MRTSTLFRYLLGNREAILTIAGNRHALWIGFLFVLSAGFAREYDGEDLLHEPWHLVIPLGASLASSFALFSLAYGVTAAKGALWRAFFTNYASFLGLFWMTEPPPKRFDGHAQNDDLLAVLTIIARTEPARWVSDLYLDKVAELFEPQWWDLGSDACWRFAQELKHRPEGGRSCCRCSKREDIRS
jgi:hypothetical protein